MAYITVAELRAYLDTTGSDTFTADASNDKLTLSDVQFAGTIKAPSSSPAIVTTLTASSTGTLPAGLAADTVYYAIPDVDQLIQLATTSALAVAGTQIDITDAGTGTHTITKAISDTSLLDDAIDDAKAYIDGETFRTFEAETTTRYYPRETRDVWDSGLLHIEHDLLTITSLANGDSDATAITAASYWLTDSEGGRNDGPPFHGILLKDNSGVVWIWDVDGWVAVTGTWGYSATVPDDVRRAALRLSAFFYRQKDSHIFETTAIPEAGVITIPVGIPKGVTNLINKYKRYI